MRRRDEDDKPIKKQRGNCWVCDGTGRVKKYGGTKLVPCGECRGGGWLHVD